jgi:hypothetical protein
MFGYVPLHDVRLLPIEEKPFHRDRYFPKPDEGEITTIVMGTERTDIEKLLRYIHSKYGDEGLRVTLIHKLFSCSNSEIAYYIPELVYISIKKDSRHMKKVLLHHAKHNESLKRLVTMSACRSCGTSRLSQL